MTADFLNLKLPLLLGLIIFLNACGPIGGKPSDQSPSLAGSGPTTQPGLSTPSIGDANGSPYKPVALPWESAAKNGLLWSSYAYQIIGSLPPDQMLDGSSDITDFCPNYAALSSAERVNFWAFLIASVAKYESGFNPVSRYQESTMGTDAITNQPVYSEGLLQLSYQDIQGYKFCEFNWTADQSLSPTDPKKTILDPLKNLRCGIKILAGQVKRTGKIALTSGVYWSTLKLGGTYSKVPQIEAMTKAIPFCKI